MPPRSGKIRRAKMGPRFSGAANNQHPRFFRDAEDILGYPQYYLQDTAGEQETQAVPSPPEVDAYDPRPAAQAPVPTHWSTQSSSILPPAATSNPPLVELSPSPARQLGRPFEFPAFHLTIPPCHPRTTSPPFEHPSMLLNPNTVPYQATPRTWAREPGHVFQPAPHRPIDLTSISANLLRPSRSSTAPNELPMAPATEWSDNMPVDQPDNNPFALQVIIEDNQSLRRAVFGINQSYKDDNTYIITSYADAQAFTWFHGYLDSNLLHPNINLGPTFDDSIKQRFSCTTDQGWVDDIIKSDYWLTDIYDSGLLQLQPYDQWRSKVNVWLDHTTGVALWQRLRYAIVQDPFLYDGKQCAPSFIWIVLLVRRVLVSLPYAQHLGVLERLGEKELDPCDTTFSFFTLTRVVVELMDAITFRCRGVNLSKVPLEQRKVLSTCGHGHLRVTILGSHTLRQFNDDIPLSVPEGIDFTHRFKKCFMKTLEEIDGDGLTSLAVARCTHPLGFFF